MSGEIRTIIADDEPAARRGVRQLLESHGDVHVVGEATNGREAAALILTLRPDLLLLDIQMPELDGFSVLERSALAEVPAVVFLTAYEQFAVRAFEADATDYLVKPLVRSRFDAAMRRVRERIAFRRATAPAPSTASASTILVQTSAGEHLLRADEIDWIEASDYYAAVHALGRRFLVRVSLNAFESQLPDDVFMRVHRGVIVNLTRVREVRDDDAGAVLVLRSGAEVLVSRRNRRKVESWLARFR